MAEATKRHDNYTKTKNRTRQTTQTTSSSLKGGAALKQSKKQMNNYKFGLWVAMGALLSMVPSYALAQDEDEIKLHYVKGDTLTFYADAFALPEGANLDRLLRKLPGITYYSSGNVEVDGVTVKEMMIDSKTFFKNAISTLTGRIPAYAIYMVKFYDYDQGKRMSITLKKEYKKKWWAEFSAALGPNGRYSEKAFAMIDDKKLRMTVYANANDINDSRQPGQETEWTPAEAAKNQRTTQMGGFDYKWKQKKWDVTGFLTFNRTNTETVTDIRRTNFIESGNTFQTSHAVGCNKKMKIDTYHDFHTMLGQVDVHVKPKFTYNSGDNATVTDATVAAEGDASSSTSSTAEKYTDLINDSRKLTATLSHNYTAGISATASIKWDGKRKQLKWEAGATNKGGRSEVQTEQTINYYDASIDSTYHYHQRLFTRPIDYTDYYAKMGYIWLTKTMLGTLQYQVKHINQYERMNEDGDKIGDNSYRQHESETKHELMVKARWGITNGLGVWSMNLYLPFGLNHLERTYLRQDYNRRHTLNYFSLNAKNTYVQWRSANLHHKITLLLQSTTTVPDCEMTEDATITTDAQNYYKGNRNLKNQWWVDGRLTYTYLSQDMRYEWGMQVEHENYLNAHVTKLCYDRPSGRKLYTYDNASGNNTTKLKWVFGLPLTSGNNLFLHNSITYKLQHKVSLEETADKSSASTDGTASAVLTDVKKETTVKSIDDDLRLKWKVGAQVFTLRSRFRQSYANNNGKISRPIDWETGLLGHLHLPWKLDLATSFNLYGRRKYSTKELNTNDFVWDARLVRTFLNNRLMVVLEGFDILHQLKHVENTLTESYVSSKSTNVIPSYAMACVVYRLNHSTKKYKPSLHWY